MVPPETLDWALRLLDCEAVADSSSEPAAFRVYEKLHRRLCELAGAAGFRSLASRALALARSEAPGLSKVQIMPDGVLQGLVELPQIDQEGGAILIAQLLGLLFMFIGKALTLRLLRDAWPDSAFDDCDSGTRGKA